MAFVFKSERRTTLGEKKSSELGPGQYIAQENENRKVKPSSKAPFLTTTNRTFVSNVNKKEEIPGPGAYYKTKEENDFPSPLNPVKTKKLNPIYKNLEYDQPTSFEKLGFNTKEKRFNFGELTKNNLPGPGQYDFSKINVLKDKKIIINKKPKKNYDSDTTSNKVITIPSKDKCFGYDILENGKTVLANDPLKFIKYAGEKTDSVGPGAYEVSTGNAWLKKGTTWSKFKTKKSTFGDVKGNSEKKLRISQSFQEDENYIEKRRVEREKVFKHLKEKKEKRKKMVETFHNIKTDEIEKIIKFETPGPGYYETSTSTFWKKGSSNLPENFQFFGSISERFPKQFAENDSVGPGSYFRDDTKLQLLRKRQLDKVPFNSNAKREISYDPVEKFPGPGTYDAQKLKSKKFFTAKTIFNSNTKRFIEKEKDLITVPVSYIKIDNDVHSDLSNGANRFKFTAPFKSPERNIDAFVGSKKDDVPPIGWYNADYINNLSYNVGKKIYRPTMVDVPFNSMKKRFIESKFDYNLGPGHYFKEISGKEGKDQMLPPFKTSERRFKKEKLETDLGPGIYNQTSYFDWNKKTFNINFL